MNLAKKQAVSELLIQNAVKEFGFQALNILWSGGKDSTVLLHLIRKLYGRVPFRVTFADCGYEFPEVYQFIKDLTAKWQLPLDRLNYLSPETKAKFEAGGQKNKKLLVRDREKMSQIYVKEHQLKLTFSGIRWFEHFHRINRFRARYAGLDMLFPLLHWTNDEIWAYIRANQVPYVSLYDQGYLHLDLVPFTKKQKGGFLVK